MKKPRKSIEPLFPELEQRRNELWHEWNRLMGIWPRDQIAINAAHKAASEAEQKWADAYSSLE